MTVFKIIGYGFSTQENTKPNHLTLSEFVDHLREASVDYDITGVPGDFPLEDCVYRSKDVICIVPPHHLSDWIRINNPIDMAELESSESYSHINYLSHGLPGYRGMMDVRSGKLVPCTMYMLLQKMNDEYDKKSEAEKMTDEFEIMELARSLGFMTSTDALENVVPVVPRFVRELSRYLGLSKNDKDSLRLRPMSILYGVKSESE